MEIRNEIYTVYCGQEFIVYRESPGKYQLLCRDIDRKNELLKLGFQHVKSLGGLDVLKKTVTKEDELQAFSIHTYGIYEKHEFPIGRETDTQYELISAGFGVDELGFEMIDRGEYFKWVDKSEVDPVYERKTPMPNFFR